MSTTPGKHTTTRERANRFLVGGWGHDRDGMANLRWKDVAGYMAYFADSDNADLLAAAKAALAVIISLDIYKKYEPVIAQLRAAIGRAEG